MTYQEYPPAPPVQQGSPTPPVYATPPYYAAPPKMNIIAVIAFVAAFMVPIAAIVLGHIALSQVKRSGEQGRGLALAGLIIGYVYTAFAIVFFIVWLGLVVGMLATHGFSTNA